MKLNILSILMLALMFSACNINNNDEDIVISTSSENLIIENNLSVKIYYNVMDNECAPYTDWGAFADVNVSIKAGDSKKINFKDIYTDKERSLNKGDKVEFNWWTDKYLEESHPERLDGDGETYGTKYIVL
jgi:hypothetical protein